MKNQFRINASTLLVFNYSETSRKNFLFVEKQFTENVTDNIVWTDDYLLIPTKHKINKVFNNSPLINEYDLDVKNSRFISCKLLFKQGFNWKDLFGTLLVIKGLETDNIYQSILINTNNLEVNFENSVELIDGIFWTASFSFNIPRISEENLGASIEYVKFDDVEIDEQSEDFGKLLNYPDVFESLVTSKPIPDFIQTSLSVLDSQYISFEVITTEVNKTIEQSILDYFDFGNNVLDIQVRHVLKYGTENIGYKTLAVSNEDNVFGKIVIGLDFSEFQTNLIEFFVSTEIVCNNILMKREKTLIIDTIENINPVLNKLITGNVEVFPVKVENKNIVTNTIIETITENKIIGISQPVFVEMVKEDIIFENKNIYFDFIEKPAYLIIKNTAIEDQFILSKDTIDGKIYFDLSDIILTEEDKVEYNIVDQESQKIMSKGFILR